MYTFRPYTEEATDKIIVEYRFCPNTFIVQIRYIDKAGDGWKDFIKVEADGEFKLFSNKYNLDPTFVGNISFILNRKLGGMAP